jgi:SAM-dependent methyltransferase
MSIEQIQDAYARRVTGDSRYHPLNPAQLHALQERERVLADLMRRHGWSDSDSLHITELGCGAGGNLLGLLRLGCRADRLTGVELLPERLALARSQLPAALQLIGGDARNAGIEAGSQQLVLMATVFSSVLDEGLQQQLADTAWRWLQPGGAILGYDFAVDNPANPDVRGVSVARWRQLFPQAVDVDVRRLTLAPPLARRLPAWALPLFNALPLLRTHRFLHLRKP